jgi:hypothetical protein
MIRYGRYSTSADRNPRAILCYFADQYCLFDDESGVWLRTLSKDGFGVLRSEVVRYTKRLASV